MNTHFFVYNGKCYVAHYYRGTSPCVTKVVNMDDQEMIPTGDMLVYATADILNTRPILQDA